jgi:hypothetical protein
LEDDPLARKKRRLLAHLKAGVEKGATAGRNVIAIAHAIAMAASKPPGPDHSMVDVIHELLHFSGRYSYAEHCSPKGTSVNSPWGK